MFSYIVATSLSSTFAASEQCINAIIVSSMGEYGLDLLYMKGVMK